MGVFAGCSSDRSTEPRDVGFSNASLRVGNNVYISNSGSVNLQSEQSAIVAHQAGGDVVLVGYNDLETNPGATFNGLATSSVISSGGGAVTWPTRTVLLPTGPFSALRGDPWLVANAGSGQLVYYASIGEVPSNPPDVAVSLSKDGGQTFADFVRAGAGASVCSVGTDKESIDASADGKSVWVAYRCDNGFNQTSIRVARSTDAGQSWSDALVRNLPSATNGGLPSPVIKRDPMREMNVFVAWEEDTNTSAKRTIQFAMSADGGATFPTMVTPVDEKKGPDPAFDGFSTTATNLQHFSFEFDPSNDHCVIAYDLDGGIFFTGSADGVNWGSPVTIAADVVTERFQPFLRGSPTHLAITYYAQPSSGPSFQNTIVFGKLSNDHGATWTAASDQLTAIGNGFVTDGFQACVQDPALARRFGDYLGETPLWAPWQAFNDTLARRFLSAWADSRPSCSVENPGTAIHQHTVGQVWGL
ncbi:hypothetical protein BH09MYX1_BH09MYX1_26670 [soil metagenome]